MFDNIAKYALIFNSYPSKKPLGPVGQTPTVLLTPTTYYGNAGLKIF